MISNQRFLIVFFHFELNFNFAGRGVFTRRDFAQHDFLLHYKGDLISYEEALDREKRYSDREKSFMFYFRDGEKTLWLVQPA